MTIIESITLGAPDPAAAEAFYREAFGLGSQIRVQASDAPTSGFRGYTVSLVVAQPADVDLYVEAALAAGATATKPVAKSLWGYGGAVQAPDGAVWTVATSAKKDGGPAKKAFDSLVLLLGVADVKASRRFYEERGLPVKRSFGGKYAEFDAPAGHVKLALNGRKALAKNAGVDPAGNGDPRLVVHTDGDGFTDPDGFTWERAAVPAAA